MPNPLPIAFVDTETTHLSAEIGEAWEVAVILREHDDQDGPADTEYVWQIRPDLTTADPEALRIGRYEERYAMPPGAEAAFTLHESGHVTPMTRAEAITAITNVLSGTVIVGSNPAFDERFLRKLLGPGNAQWHYRPYDIVQLAAVKLGVPPLGPLPWSTHALSRAVGVEPPAPDVAHTALGDARWARDVHDAVMVKAQLPLTWEGRAQHAIGLYTQTAIELEDTRRELRTNKDTVERLRERHKGNLRRADQINNDLMAEVQRYAEGTERPVLWSVYNKMHGRAATAEATLSRVQRIVRRLAAHAVGFRDVLDEGDAGAWGRTVGTDLAELSAALESPSQPVMTGNHHFGRAWAGHAIEDACPCTKAPCGLVAETSPECTEHSTTKSTRQSHPADACPGPDAPDA